MKNFHFHITRYGLTEQKTAKAFSYARILWHHNVGLSCHIGPNNRSGNAPHG